MVLLDKELLLAFEDQVELMDGLARRPTPVDLLSAGTVYGCTETPKVSSAWAGGVCREHSTPAGPGR